MYMYGGAFAQPVAQIHWERESRHWFNFNLEFCGIFGLRQITYIIDETDKKTNNC
jgi:hypothetical protein